MVVVGRQYQTNFEVKHNIFATTSGRVGAKGPTDPLCLCVSTDLEAFEDYPYHECRMPRAPVDISIHACDLGLIGVKSNSQ